MENTMSKKLTFNMFVVRFVLELADQGNRDMFNYMYEAYLSGRRDEFSTAGWTYFMYNHGPHIL